MRHSRPLPSFRKTAVPLHTARRSNTIDGKSILSRLMPNVLERGSHANTATREKEVTMLKSEISKTINNPPPRRDFPPTFPLAEQPTTQPPEKIASCA